MKILSSALIAAALVTVAIPSTPVVHQRPPTSDLTTTTQAPLVTAQARPGDCCNDDFRQALPRSGSLPSSTFAEP